jgi:C1A family cysteine protease
MVIDQRRIKKYGWIPDIPDKRDMLMTVQPGITVPPEMDLRPNVPLPPFDQGDLGSCTANATVGAIVFDQKRQGLPVEMMSRLYLYYWSRYIEHTIPQDSGAMLRDVMKAYNKHGVCPEAEWPYDIPKFAVKPTKAADTDAAVHKPLIYKRVGQSPLSLKRVLAAGYPIVFGFSVYESFESNEVAKTGIVPMPGGAESLLGGHAVLAVGYKFINGRLYFTVRNSWGTGWGDAGHFYMPMEYLTDPDLASDFWCVTQVR